MTDSILFLITLLAFISTNLDDLFILMAFFSKKEFPRRDVVMGQYIGLLLLILISSMAYFFQLFIPNYLIGLLGFIPIIIGVKNLLNLYRDSNSDRIHLNEPKKRFKFMQVALVTFANGGDNIGVYAPIFASLSFAGILQVVLIFMAMTGIWCIVSFKLVENKILGGKIKSYGHIIFPFVLITIGLLIIFRTYIS